MQRRNQSPDRAADPYDLPVGTLGRHPDEFYGAMSRIACICAVLEEKVVALRHALARTEQGRFTHEPVSAQMKAARPLRATYRNRRPS